MAYLVVKRTAKILLISLVVLGILVVLCTRNVICYNTEISDSRGDIDVNSTKKRNKEINRYKIFVTGANYIKIRVKDAEGGGILNMIVDNKDLASFLAIKHGLKMDKLGRFVDKEAYAKFINEYYIKYMENNENKIIEINFNKFKKIVGKRHSGKEEAGNKIVETYIFDKPMTLEQLGVNNEQELIKKYFDFNGKIGEGKIKEEYENEISRSSAFIATLINLGYIVGRGDYVPFLFIRITK